jgi:hypothetical protein
MEEFIKEYYYTLIRSFELIAAVIAFVVYEKYKSTPTKYFLWFLIYVFFMELFGSYTIYLKDYEFLSGIRSFLKDTPFESNNWWYNIFWSVVSVLFYTFYFIKILRTEFYRKIIKYGRMLFVLIVIMNFIINFDNFFLAPPILNVLFGSLLILLSIILYFIEILDSNKMLEFYKSINFYIAAVNFVWILIVTPIVFYNKYYSALDWNFVISRRMIFVLSTMFMYVTFSVALIKCRPDNDLFINKE